MPTRNTNFLVLKTLSYILGIDVYLKIKLNSTKNKFSSTKTAFKY